MTSSMILGRFLPGHSFVHRLDPRLKLLLSIYLITLVLFANNVWTYGLLFGLLFSLVALTKISFSFFFRGLKSLIWLILFTVCLQVFFSTGSTSYWHFGIINVTKEGIILAVFTFCRFLLIVFFSTILTLTTSPLALADACENMLAPLKVFKVPAHEIALMLSIALRFIPTLLDEAVTIVNAQKARGVDFNSGSLIKRAKAMLPIFIPLLVSSFKRAEQLADAMEARGYQSNIHRTSYRKLQWQKLDTYAVLIMVIFTIIFILCR